MDGRTRPELLTCRASTASNGLERGEDVNEARHGATRELDASSHALTLRGLALRQGRSHVPGSSVEHPAFFALQQAKQDINESLSGACPLFRLNNYLFLSSFADLPVLRRPTRIDPEDAGYCLLI